MKILIVGGGPVGLTAAISLMWRSQFGFQKKYEYTIDIYEKRKKYTREQFIVSGGSKGNLLSNYPVDLRQELKEHFFCYIDNPVFDTFGFCFQSKIYSEDFYDFSQVIEIKKLERILSRYIRKKYKKKINIIKKECKKEDIEKYDVIIGADGQNSFIRNKIMKVKWKNMKDYETYILHIKYTDLSNKKYKIQKKLFPNKFLEAYELKLKRKNPNEYDNEKVFEQDRFRIIRSNTTKTQFLLQINKSTYNKIKKIKTFGKLPKKIQHSVLIDSALMGSRPTNLKKTPINVYNSKVGHSEKYSIIKNKKLFLLVGDSAMTSHVFTGEGLNVNFNILRITINKYFEKNNVINRRYNRILNRHFLRNIKYKAMLRYIPHKLLKKICSTIKVSNIYKLLDEVYLYRYNYIIEDLQEKNNISDNEIKNELCLVLRDFIMKYYTYKLSF